MQPDVPTIGRIVWYQTDGRNGLSYTLPAMVTCTIDTHPGDYPDGSKNPLPVPADEFTVHLTVFTPGGFGTKVNGVDTGPMKSTIFKDALQMIPGSGTYVEWNVPCFQLPRVQWERSWRWPERRS